KPTLKIRFTEPQIAFLMRAHPNCNLDRLTEVSFEFDQSGNIVDCVDTIKDGGKHHDYAGSGLARLYEMARRQFTTPQTSATILRCPKSEKLVTAKTLQGPRSPLLPSWPSPLRPTLPKTSARCARWVPGAAEGAGTQQKMITKLEQGDFLLADTAMGEQDPKNKKWVHINGVPRIDGPDAIGKTYTRGWVARRYVQTLLCPDDQAAAARPLSENKNENASFDHCSCARSRRCG